MAKSSVGATIHHSQINRIIFGTTATTYFWDYKYNLWDRITQLRFVIAIISEIFLKKSYLFFNSAEMHSSYKAIQPGAYPENELTEIFY